MMAVLLTNIFCTETFSSPLKSSTDTQYGKTDV
jgi:hypothetical protein